MLQTASKKNSPHNSSTYRLVRRAGKQGMRCSVNHQADNGKHSTDDQILKQLSARSNQKIGTWDVRKIKEVGKLQKICWEMDRNNKEILGMSEANWNGSGCFKTGTGYTVLFAGKEEGYSCGVAMVLNKDSIQSLLCYAPVSVRILKMRLQATPLIISKIQFYAPTNARSEEEIEKFYNVLQEGIDNTPSCDIKLIMRDANSKVGKSSITTENYGIYGLGECNEGGESSIDFCKTNSLSILNTLFSHHSRRLYTWKSPDGKARSQIEFIMISQKCQSSVKNTKTLPGADCNSDHQLLVADIKIGLKRLQKNSSPLRLDFSTISKQYKVQLDNRFMSLLACEEDTLPSALWEEEKHKY